MACLGGTFVLGSCWTGEVAPARSERRGPPQSMDDAHALRLMLEHLASKPLGMALLYRNLPSTIKTSILRPIRDGVATVNAFYPPLGMFCSELAIAACAQDPQPNTSRKRRQRQQQEQQGQQEQPQQEPDTRPGSADNRRQPHEAEEQPGQETRAADTASSLRPANRATRKHSEEIMEQATAKGKEKEEDGHGRARPFRKRNQVPEGEHRGKRQRVTGTQAVAAAPVERPPRRSQRRGRNARRMR